MRKALVVFLTLILTLSLASCGEKEAGGGEHDNVYGCQDTFI